MSKRILSSRMWTRMRDPLPTASHYSQCSKITLSISLIAKMRTVISSTSRSTRGCEEQASTVLMIKTRLELTTLASTHLMTSIALMMRLHLSRSKWKSNKSENVARWRPSRRLLRLKKSRNWKPSKQHRQIKIQMPIPRATKREQKTKRAKMRAKTSTPNRIRKVRATQRLKRRETRKTNLTLKTQTNKSQTKTPKKWRLSPRQRMTPPRSRRSRRKRRTMRAVATRSRILRLWRTWCHVIWMSKRSCFLNLIVSMTLNSSMKTTTALKSSCRITESRVRTLWRFPRRFSTLSFKLSAVRPPTSSQRERSSARKKLKNCSKTTLTSSISKTISVWISKLNKWRQPA